LSLEHRSAVPCPPRAPIAARRLAAGSPPNGRSLHEGNPCLPRVRHTCLLRPLTSEQPSAMFRHAGSSAAELANRLPRLRREGRMNVGKRLLSAPKTAMGVAAVFAALGAIASSAAGADVNMASCPPATEASRGFRTFLP